MGTHSESSGVTQGALVVIFGMLLGGLAVLCIQRVITNEKQRVLKTAYEFHEGRKK